MTRTEKWLLALGTAAGLAMAGTALLGRHGLPEVRRLREDTERVSREIQELRRRELEARRDIRNLRENPRAIEARAREDLGMIREGETIFLLPERHGQNR